MARLESSSSSRSSIAHQSHCAGENASDAFHLVIHRFPVSAFRGDQRTWARNSDRIARAWAELMKHLGYGRYVAQGGDGDVPSPARWHASQRQGCSASISTAAATAARCSSGARRRRAGSCGLSETERAAFASVDTFLKSTGPMASSMGTRAARDDRLRLADSPVGLAAWISSYDGRARTLLDRDDVLDRRLRLLADQHGDFVGADLLGDGCQSVILSSARKTCRDLAAGRHHRVPTEEVYRAPEPGPGVLIATSSPRRGGLEACAAWEQPKPFSLKRFAQRSDRLRQP